MNSSLHLMNKIPCDLRNMLRAEAELFQKLGAGAGMPENVIDADPAHGYRAVLTEHACDRLSEAAYD